MMWSTEEISLLLYNKCSFHKYSELLTWSIYSTLDPLAVFTSTTVYIFKENWYMKEETLRAELGILVVLLIYPNFPWDIYNNIFISMEYANSLTIMLNETINNPNLGDYFHPGYFVLFSPPPICKKNVCIVWNEFFDEFFLLDHHIPTFVLHVEFRM